MKLSPYLYHLVERNKCFTGPNSNDSPDPQEATYLDLHKTGSTRQPKPVKSPERNSAKNTIYHYPHHPPTSTTTTQQHHDEKKEERRKQQMRRMRSPNHNSNNKIVWYCTTRMLERKKCTQQTRVKGKMVKLKILCKKHKMHMEENNREEKMPMEMR